MSASDKRKHSSPGSAASAEPGVFAPARRSTSQSLLAGRFGRAMASRSAAMAPLVINATLTPHWRVGERERFTYRRELGDGAAEFVEIDAASGSRRAPFDAAVVAEGMSQLLGKPVDPQRLPFQDYEEGEDSIEFESDGHYWTCSVIKASCMRVEKSSVSATEWRSPDGKWVAFMDGGNLGVRSTGGEERFMLTSDAIPRYGYALESEATIAQEIFGEVQTPDGSGTRREGPPVPPTFLSVAWSPDSTKLLTHKLDERNVRDVVITQHAPTDGSSYAITWTWKSSAPNDLIVPMAELWVFNVTSRAGHRLAVDPIPILYLSPVANNRLWWQPDSRYAALVTEARYRKSVSFRLIDTVENTVSTPIEESGATFVEVASDETRPNVHVLSSGDVVWYSERSGRAHLYLYDGPSGQLKYQLTHGPNSVGRILRVDETNGLIYVAMNSEDSQHDPYFQKIYSVRVRDGALTLLTPEPEDHHVVSMQESLPFMKREVPESVQEAMQGFSPSAKYFVEGSSLTGVPTSFVLRRASGEVVTVVETTDVSRLYALGWVPPERFSVLASDDETLIWGTIWKPHDFDPEQSYPILDSIYPGPQMCRAPPGFAASTLDLFDGPSLAELGLIVVAVDGRGTPGRSKMFRDISYGNLGEAGSLDDHVAAIRELARRHRWLDTDRVGILGSSGGGFAAVRAMFKYPDFYAVGVSDAGNHDLRGYLASWAEKYMGPDDRDSYQNAANAPLAAGLKGKLLLLHGEMDANVPPALTWQIAVALQRANKAFDLMIVPNVGHTTLFFPGKPLQAVWEFLVTSLIGTSQMDGVETS